MNYELLLVVVLAVFFGGLLVIGAFYLALRFNVTLPKNIEIEPMDDNFLGSESIIRE